jgi:hypothetical protein
MGGDVHAHFRRGLLACIVPILAATLAGPAAAQEPAAPRRCDEAWSDSVSHDMSRKYGPHGPLMAFFAAFYLAPSALLLMPTCFDDEHELGFWRDHVSVNATGGLMVSDWHGAAAHSAGLEVLALGAYAEVRLDRYHRSDRVETWDARAGYLIHPYRSVAGGVTVGWREAPDVPDGWSGGGVLIGFPIVVAACGERRPCWVQWEPIYMISDRGLGFTPRLRLAVPIPRTPLLGRLDLEAKGMRKKDPLSVSLGFGLRP